MRNAGSLSVPDTANDQLEKETKVSAAIAALESLDRDALCVRWRSIVQSESPPRLPRWLMFRILAYRIQAEAFGALDRASVRLLDQIADEQERHRASGKAGSLKAVSVPPAPRNPIRPGTILVREHDRKLHQVVVIKGGFSWNGKEFRSLTEVAFAITGTRWNGPRFFGLRSKRLAKEESSP